MKFLTDENIFLPIVSELRKLGFDVFDIKEQNLSGINDSELFNLAEEQNRVLVTMDKDFTSIIEYPIGTHPGIIVLKLYRLPIEEVTNIFINSLKKLPQKEITGNIIIIDKSKTRIRKNS